MTKMIKIIEFKKWKRLILSVRIIDYKNKIELNNIFNLVNCHDLNFSIFPIELLNMQNLYEILPI